MGNKRNKRKLPTLPRSSSSVPTKIKRLNDSTCAPVHETAQVNALVNWTTPGNRTSIDEILTPLLPTESAVEAEPVAEGEFIIEKEICNKDNDGSITGRRLINIQHFLNQLAKISEHALEFGCNFSCLELKSEKRKGLDSIFTFLCKMCLRKFSVSSNENCDDSMDVNQQAVSAIMSIGSGFAHLQLLTSKLEIPGLSPELYLATQNRVCDWWEKVAAYCMADAAKEEAAYAISEGNISPDGKPMITVIADGCWSKRSYRTNYSALSGAAAIIGLKTGKVLYLGVKNKYCIICARAANASVEPSQHTCYKNYNGPSTGMESAILVEGFQNSLEMYGLIYNKLIADGDCSTYKAILDSRPYDNITVEKIECKNHLLRNYCNALIKVTQDTANFPLELRKVVKERYLRLRYGVYKAILHWGAQDLNFEEKVQQLAKDIRNGPQHVFGDHSNCSGYFCTPEKQRKEPINLIPSFISSGLMEVLRNLSKRLSLHARSLILNVTSNLVESFNAQVAKCIGGKRINYSQRRSYSGRCAASVVSFNNGLLHTTVNKVIFGNDKMNLISRVEKLRKAKVGKQKKRPSKVHTTVLKDSYYGATCQKPDMNPTEYEKEKENFVNELNISNLERHQLERNTLLQRRSAEWMSRRRKLLTASNFGEVCKRGPATCCAPLVKKIVYGNNLSSLPAVQYGINNEERAIRELSLQENIFVEDCGLFVDESIPFLGATPDAIYGDGIVEIKCPSSLANMRLDQAMEKHAFWKLNKVNRTYEINKNHNWFFQVQGQLHVTKRDICLFAIWFGENLPLKVYRINRDDQFWKEKMEEKLSKFYLNCVLPELVDPRTPRSMDIREPDYILKAIEAKRARAISRI